MKKYLLVCLLLICPAVSSAQSPNTGLPPFASIEQGSFDAVNRQDLNVNFAIPIVSSQGRGRTFDFSIVYDSLIWQKVANAWVPVTDQNGAAIWGWKKNFPTGFTSLKVVSANCDTVPITHYNHYTNYVYTDMAGTKHPFPINAYQPNNCDLNPQMPQSANASDGSGFHLSTTTGLNPVVTAAAGTIITGAGWTDPNGNFISATVVNSNETDWKDTAGHTAMKVITSASSIQYQVAASDGTFQTYTLLLQTYNIKTNFACGVVEYNGTASLPYELDLPNSTKYLFTYEATPSFPTFFTGRLSQVTLPMGGSYQYQYPAGSNNGISCTDAGVNSLTRMMSDRTTPAQWVYSRASNVTTVTAPLQPGETVQDHQAYTFNTSGQETKREYYQGNISSANLLRTITKTWAANGTPATAITALEDGTTKSEVETTYDSYGNLLNVKQHDLGSGGIGTIIRTTDYTYLSGSAYILKNIVNRVTQIKITDNIAGIVKSRTDINYDEAAYSNTSCPTAVPQHDDTYSCTFLTRGNPTTVTIYTNAAAPSGAIVKHTYYDFFGNVVKADVNCCQQKQWVFSATTNYSFPDSIIRGPVGNQLTSSATYKAATGQIATATDENGKVTIFSYDVMSRLSDIQRSDSQHLVYTSDDVARTIRITAPIQGTNVSRQTIFFDGLSRPVKQQTTDSAGTSYSIVETQYDSWERPYRVSNPHNSTAQYWTETRFDALGRPIMVIPQDGSPTSNRSIYGYALNTVTTTDPTGRQRKTQIDGLGRLAKVFEPDVSTGVLNQETDYTYTALDRLLTVTQGLQSRNYTYDDLGRVLTAKTPETNQVQTSFQYDPVFPDLLTQRTDPRGVITTYAYDTLNRLHQISYNVGATGVPATPTVTLGYGASSASNNNGRLLTLTDGVGSETYSYDVLGRCTQLQKVINGTTYTTGYAYNFGGELTQITYPSGRIVQPGYDTVGRLASIASGGTNYVSGFAFNPAGEPTGFNYGNGVTAAMTYNSRQQLGSLSYTKSATTLLGLSYNYLDASGNNSDQILGVTDNVDNGRSVVYTYDKLNRLGTAVTTGSATYPKWGLSWTYDRYGNRTGQAIAAGCVLPMICPTNSVGISPTTNRVTDSPYNYDTNGNMINDGVNALAYDAENRAITAAGATYTYDGNNLRVKRLSGGTTTVYIFSGSKVIAEYDNGAAVTSPSREHIYLGGQLLANITGSTIVYVHPDHLSPRLVTSTTGTKLGEQGHYPFGESWYAVNTTTKFGFTTYERDTESGNDYAEARYYVGRLGRFSSVDPLAGSIGNPQSDNSYAYVFNSPPNLTDRTGLVPCSQTKFGAILQFCGNTGGVGGGGLACTLDGVIESCGTVARLGDAGALAGASSPLPAGGNGVIMLWLSGGSIETDINGKSGIDENGLVVTLLDTSRDLRAFDGEWVTIAQFIGYVNSYNASLGNLSDDQRLRGIARGVVKGAGSLNDPSTYALWFGASAVGGFVVNLDVAWVAVGEGNPFHMAVGADGGWIHAAWEGGSELTMTENQAAAWVKGYSWARIPVPVLSTEGVLGTAGATASSCVAGVCQAILNGWR